MKSKYIIALLMTICSCMALGLYLQTNEINRLNLSIAAFEIQAAKDTDLIEALKSQLNQKLKQKKKVICLDIPNVA